MHIASIRIRNFRNLADVTIEGMPAAAVVLGENNSGKSNLLHALRLVLDPSLPAEARQLASEDFWDGLPAPFGGAEVEVSLKLAGFDGNTNAQAVLADSIVAVSPYVARLTYLYRASGRSTLTTSSRDDYEFLIFGGNDEANRVRSDVRRLISLRVLPALRDAEGDLASWSRSPLRALLEDLPLTRAMLQPLATDVTAASESLLRVPAIRELEEAILARLLDLAGATFDPKASLGIGAARPDELIRAVRLFVESGRSLGATGLGSANLVFLALLLEGIAARRSAGDIVSAIIGVEEPEAHLHPHLQRVLFRYLLRSEPALIVTTHSPQIASVAPLRSLILLRRQGNSSVAATVSGAGLTDEQVEDLERYLDAVRADFLFARGVILVEGPAELYLIPAYARSMGIDIDQLGITCSSVHGVDFAPYMRLLGSPGLSIPFVVVTDGDMDTVASGVPGLKRGAQMLGLSDRRRVESEIASRHYAVARSVLATRGVFVGRRTLETDIALIDPGAVVAAFNDLNSGAWVRTRFRNAVQRGTTRAGRKEIVGRITLRGKGRYAQRLADYVQPTLQPRYIRDAILAIVAALP